MSTRRARLIFLVALAVLFGATAIDAHHAVLRFNIEEMTATADRVFIGRCISVTESEEMIAQGPTPITSFTFEVEQAIKGKLPRQITFRQLGHTSRRVSKESSIVKKGMIIHGMPGYRVGDRVVLFLIPNYSDGNVTYPVGVAQGAFFVAETASGGKTVRNGLNNLGLFTAPYNGTKMKERDARIIFPDRDTPMDSQGLSAQTEALVRKRGALPLESFVELVERIVVAHGDQRGEIVGAGKGAILQ
jgi:hypothetical protein